ncbi:MAG: helix-turn-helix domain-containing protein [Syntrophomonadaceae bacterium]|nr:helix-turn-helix domain-containing protein [Syntrophomonadaceae bacterium]
MAYMSVREAAENWNISERRVQKLCEQGRVPGAERFGHYWILPQDSKKPEDKRLTPKQEKARGVHSPRPGDRNPLFLLKKAWELKTHGLDSEFDALLAELLPLVKAREGEPELYGEWLLLSSFRHHPHLCAMTAVLREAAPYFNGKSSRVILPLSLFPFANFGVFFHIPLGAGQGAGRSTAFRGIHFSLFPAHRRSRHGGGYFVPCRNVILRRRFKYVGNTCL